LSETQNMQIKNLTHVYKGSKRVPPLIVYENFHLDIPEGKVTCVMGPSGCGKTTFLNIISGLTKPQSGIFSGFDRKTVSCIFQEPRLLPWKTTSQNIDYVLKDLYPVKQREEKIKKYLDLVELSTFKDYWPDKLSGGMKQRLNIARAFAYPSNLLLMDEPFKGLDLQLKISLLNSFNLLWENDRRTVIFVTHDPDEALYLADNICVLSALPAKLLDKIDITIPRFNRRFAEGMTELKEKLLESIGLPKQQNVVSSEIINTESHI